MSALKDTTLNWLALAILTCCLLTPLIGNHWTPPRDFDMFYTAGKVYLQESHNRLYDLNVQARVQQRIYGLSNSTLGKRFLLYNHPPFELVIFFPLTKLQPITASWIWRAINLMLLVAALFIFKNTMRRYTSLLVLVLISLAFFPVPYCLLAGQDTFLTFFLFAISLFLLNMGRDFTAGLVLG